MLDEKDLAILRELMRDARQTTKSISRKLGIPRSTIYERIKRMVKNGVIKGFTAIPDFGKLGLPITAFVLVSFLPNPEISQTELAKRISMLDGVYEVHIVSGEWDLLLKVRGRSMEEIGELVIEKLRKMRGVGRTVTCISFTKIKESI
ncbi:MAG: Lrp/AsnC family transcriptional regulator [Candidatus Asgardarchaeia archaeon]|nr:Lrp/AsnC family transcriptional regulator [Candidatus Odinarchaeota archaeon]